MARSSTRTGGTPSPTRARGNPRTAPLPVLPVLSGLGKLDAQQVSKAAHCTTAFGENLEIDLDALANTDADLADTISAYWTLAEQLFTGSAAPWIGLRRVIAQAAQVDNGTGRRDLRDELHALEQLPVMREVLDVLLDSELDRDRLGRSVERANGTVQYDGEIVSVTIPVSGTIYWPDALGGPAAPGEVARSVTLTARHAKWRDRRVRRLTSLTVHADEIWPAV